MSNIPSPSPILAPNGRPFVGNPARVRSTLAKSTVDERRKDIVRLVDSIESDPQFLLGITVIRALATSATVSIEVDGETSQTQALVDNLMDVWSATLPEALKCFGYGRIAFEKIYGLYDSKAGIRPLEKLEPLPFESTEMRICKDDGRYQGIKLRIKDSEVLLDPPETWWLALDPTPKNPYGQSRYRGAPEAVLKERQKLSKNEGIFQDKFALGHGVAFAPSKYPDPESNTDTSSQPTSPLDDVANSLNALRSGGTMVLDSAVDPKTGQPLFRYEAPKTTQDATPLENRRRILDAYALRSIGVPERAVTQDDATGSYAMAEVHWKVLQNTVEGLLNAIVVSFQKYVIDPAVLMNCASANRPSLKLVAQPIRDDLRPLVIDLVKSIVAAPQVSPLLAQGVIDLEKLVEASGLPLGPDVQEAIGRVREIARQMMPMPAPMPGAAFGGAVGFGPPTATTTAETPEGSQPADSAVGKVGDAIVENAAAKDPAVAAAATDVDMASTALNGAQIASLVDIIQQVAAGQLPIGSVKPILEAAFPMLKPEVIDRIVNPVKGFTPSTDQPASDEPKQLSHRLLAASSSGPPVDGPWDSHAEALAARIAAKQAELTRALQSPTEVDRRGL